MPRLIKFLYILLWTLLALAIVPVLFLWVATLWLTPARFTDLVNSKASELLSADVRCWNADYTVWSTFPDLVVTMDSISISSRDFDNLSPELRRRLPSDPERLLWAQDVAVGIDIRDILDDDEIRFTRISALSPQVKLVEVSDSIANYRFGIHPKKELSISRIMVDSVELSGRPAIAFHSIPKKVNLAAAFGRLALRCRGEDLYALDLKGRVSLRSDGRLILSRLPFGVKGRLALGFDPMAVSTGNLRVVAGNIPLSLAADVSLGKIPMLRSCGVRVDGFDVDRLLGMFPPHLISEKFRALRPAVWISGEARLAEPYRLDSRLIPSMAVRMAVPRGKVRYDADGYCLSIDSVSLLAAADIDGRDPSSTVLRIDRLNVSGEGVSVKGRADVSGPMRSPRIAAVIDADADIAKAFSSVRAVTGIYLPSVRGNAKVDGDILLRVIDMKEVNLDEMTARMDAAIHSLHMAQNGISLGTKGIRAKAEVRFSSTDELSDMFRLDLTGRRADYAEGGLSVSLGGLAVRISGGRLAKPVRTRAFKMPAGWTADRASMAFARHSPEFVTSPMPYMLEGVMSNWRAAADITLARGSVRSAAFPADNEIGDMRVSLNFDSLRIVRARLRSGRSSANVRGTVSNLRQFINSPGPVPLPAVLAVEVDTLDCNELSRTYVAGLRATEGEKAVEALAAPQPMIASDTAAMLFPRNVRARVQASVRSLSYLDIPLSGMRGEVSLRDGRLSVDTLTAGSPFGDIGFNFLFDTSDLQRLQLGAALSVRDIETGNVYRMFDRELKSHPFIRNFSGVFSVGFTGHTHFFPKMYFNVPSAVADLYLKGRALRIDRNHFMDRIAKLMLINDRDALELDNIDIHASLRDNLLEVYPFFIEFPRYRLRVMGINNLGGDLYYQLSVKESPLHIPFGINITGTFGDPHVRLGGPRWSEARASAISALPVDPWKQNMRQSFRQMVLQAIYKAAEYGRDGLDEVKINK